MAAGEQKHPEASTKPRTKAEAILSRCPHRMGTLIVLSTMTTFPVQKFIDSLHLPRGDLAFSISLDLPQGHGATPWQMRRISAINLQTFQMVSRLPPLPCQTWWIRAAAAVGTGGGKKPPSLPSSSPTGAACVPAS